MNNILGIILMFGFILMILKKLHQIRQLIIREKKNSLEIILPMMIFISIIILYAHSWFHYLFGFLGMVMFITMWLAQGMTTNGFLSLYRYKEKIYWNEIQKVSVHIAKKIKVTVSGGFMQQTFYFENDDTDRILNLLRIELPLESSLEIQQKYT